MKKAPAARSKGQSSTPPVAFRLAASRSAPSGNAASSGTVAVDGRFGDLALPLRDLSGLAPRLSRSPEPGGVAIATRFGVLGAPSPFVGDALSFGVFDGVRFGDRGTSTTATDLRGEPAPTSTRTAS